MIYFSLFSSILVTLKNKMDINSLRTHELSYEIAIRGIEVPDTADDRRKILRGILAQEKKGIVSLPIKNILVFAEDVSGIEESLDDVSQRSENFSGNSSEPEFVRITTRLNHLTLRISRLNAVEEREQKIQNAFKMTILGLEGDLDEKVQNFVRGSSPSDTTTSNTTPVVTNPVSNPVVPVNHFPPYKWDIKFSGSGPRESLNAFLEKIELVSQGRGVSKAELFASSCDLFTGPAWTWYITNKNKLNSWDDLVRKLREDFLPYHYEQDLLREIDQRTQGSNERVVFFITSMESLFNRLQSKPSEQFIVDKIRQNLIPSYINRLALYSPTTVSELTQLCRRLEESDDWSNRYKPPSSRTSNLLEPDLSIPFSNLSISHSKHVSSKPFGKILGSAAIECWNCHSSGHSFNDCPSTRKIFCFGCGSPNTTKLKCTRCGPKNAEKTGVKLPDNGFSSTSPDSKQTTQPQNQTNQTESKAKKPSPKSKQ